MLRQVVLVAAVCLPLLGGCAALQGASATPVPGAAATAARQAATPIPTPLVRPSPAPALSPQAARGASPIALPSPSQAPRTGGEEEAQVTLGRLEQILASPDLAGIEELFLDSVSLSTIQGGQVFDRVGAAAWLRERIQPGVRVAYSQRSSLAVLLEIGTEGWRTDEMVPSGHVTFNLHRYDAQGRLDEDRGAWKVDVIAAE